jgi:MFS superfamily sulfate permease-like transporter
MIKDDSLSAAGFPNCNIITPENVQKVRIALLEHNTSQMQGYKYYLLTLVLGLFAVLDFWPRAIQSGIPQPIVVILVAFFLGLISGAVSYSLARFFWYGQIVGATSYAHLIKPNENEKTKTLMGHLSDCIGTHARGDMIDIKKNKNRLHRWMFWLGEHQWWLLLVCALILEGVFFLSMFFYLSPYPSLGVNFAILTIIVAIILVFLYCSRDPRELIERDLRNLRGIPS